MDKILKDFDNAYRTLGQVFVNGDSVDTMAVARAQLRGVYTELKKLADAAKKSEVEQ